MYIRWWMCALLLASSGQVMAQSSSDGDAVYKLDKYQYLRSLSLDLRGYSPEIEELQSLEALDDVVDGQIESYLNSSEFEERVVRHHQHLLWNNVTNVILTSNNRTLTRSSDLYYSSTGSSIYRGERVPCLDEPAEFTEDGYAIGALQEDGTFREGYVWVAPYWDLENPLKVCAFEAQERLETSTGISCETRDGVSNPECGCGPNLRLCTYARQQEDETLEAFGEDIDRRVKDMIRADSSYMDLFTHKYAWMNGPIADFWRYRAPVYRNVRTVPLAMPEYRIPELDFNDIDTWVKVDLDDSAAGILTSPAYLLRFQTNRSRANRFHTAFLCEPFQPPDEGLPVVDESIIPSLDLQERDGCKYCHAVLEPSASYWGRWTEQGTGYLEPEIYPAQSDECLSCALGTGSCSSLCRSDYVVDPLAEEEEAWLGWLRAYEFRRDEHMGNVENGPKVIAFNGVVDGRLPRCVVENTANWLLGGTPTDLETEWLDALAIEFVQHNYSYKFLVKSIVTSDAYRRVK